MSSAFQCDGCREYHDGRPVTTVSIDSVGYLKEAGAIARSGHIIPPEFEDSELCGECTQVMVEATIEALNEKRRDTDDETDDEPDPESQTDE